MPGERRDQDLKKRITMNNDPLTLFPCDDARTGLLGDSQALERRLLDYMVHVVGKDPSSPPNATGTTPCPSCCAACWASA